jgi:type IV fimbrial biogenesis protein FimT
MLNNQFRHPGGTRGFTLVELIAAVIISTIILTIGIPNLQEWIGRAGVRSGAEDMQNAMRLAQAEAAKRNQNVEFSLLGAQPDPTAGNRLNTAASANGTYWAVRVMPATDGGDKTYVQGGDFGSRGVDITGTASLIFNGLGQALTTPSTYLATTQVYRLASKTNKYPMCVFVRPGGGIRWCDPGSSGGLDCPTDVVCPTA